MALQKRFELHTAKHPNAYERTQKHAVTIEELAKVAKDVQKDISSKGTFSHDEHTLYSPDGKYCVKIWIGLVDQQDREFGGDWGFLTIQTFEKQDDDWWQCIGIQHCMPLDWAATEIVNASNDATQYIENIVHHQVTKGIDTAMLTASAQIHSIDAKIVELQEQRFKLEQQRLKEVSKQVKSVKGFVYLLKSNEHPDVYKIGRSVNPTNRAKTFGVKLPFPVEFDCLISTPDMYALEAELHTRFAAQRLDGEWFRLSDDDVSYIRRLAHVNE